jgi:hypothetical protein
MDAIKIHGVSLSYVVFTPVSILVPNNWGGVFGEDRAAALS